jgi:hypothetical protein
MQTFLPYADFHKSAESLDYKRLGKQRVETYQILRSLLGESKGWANHPATKMWAGHEGALAAYGLVMSIEWVNRGYNDTMIPRFTDYLTQLNTFDLPSIIGNESFHLSHQSNLIRKDPEHYRPIFGNVPDDLPYVWVIDLKENQNG